MTEAHDNRNPPSKSRSLGFFDRFSFSRIDSSASVATDIDVNELLSLIDAQGEEISHWHERCLKLEGANNKMAMKLRQHINSLEINNAIDESDQGNTPSLESISAQNSPMGVSAATITTQQREFFSRSSGAEDDPAVSETIIRYASASDFLTPHIPRFLWKLFSTEDEKRYEKTKKLRDWFNLQREVQAMKFDEKGSGNAGAGEVKNRNPIVPAMGGVLSIGAIALFAYLAIQTLLDGFHYKMTTRSTVSTSWNSPYPLPLMAVTIPNNYTLEIAHEMIPRGSPGDKESVTVTDQLALCNQEDSGFSVNIDFQAYCIPRIDISGTFGHDAYNYLKISFIPDDWNNIQDGDVNIFVKDNKESTDSLSWHTLYYNFASTIPQQSVEIFFLKSIVERIGFDEVVDGSIDSEAFRLQTLQYESQYTRFDQQDVGKPPMRFYLRSNLEQQLTEVRPIITLRNMFENFGAIYAAVAVLFTVILTCFMASLFASVLLSGYTSKAAHQMSKGSSFFDASQSSFDGSGNSSSGGGGGGGGNHHTMRSQFSSNFELAPLDVEDDSGGNNGGVGDSI